MHRSVDRVLIVEDDDALRDGIVRALHRSDSRPLLLEARTASEAGQLLERISSLDLLILDVRLPDGSVFELIRLANAMAPAPVLVAISGKASPVEAFRLARAGVRSYLAKPFSIADLEEAIDSACSDPPDLTPLVNASVGRVSLRQMQQNVRRVMVREALARSDGSRSGAARLLRVTRQAVQQMVRSAEDPTGAAAKSKALDE